jgi:phosphate transport system substrate-binding protein
MGRCRTNWFAFIAISGGAMAMLPFAAGQATSVAISESGSTLIYPLFKAWIAAYAKVAPDVHLSAEASGSGAGVDQAISKRVQIGTSDAYMSDNQVMANPDILNIPLAISAQTVNANLPELRGGILKLSGPVLADIYWGKIREWDEKPIAELNGGIRLPHQAIIPVRRRDASGDTFIFTQFLSFSTPAWEDSISYGATVNWPSVSTVLKASSNQDVLQTLARTPYALGYLGGSFQAEANKAGLLIAMLQNQDGKFLLPATDTITAAADALTPRTPPDQRLTLVFAPGPDSYPLINYEYAIVSVRQPNRQVAEAISNFLLWCINPQGGSAASFLNAVNFIPLPTAIRARSEIQIAKIR